MEIHLIGEPILDPNCVLPSSSHLMNQDYPFYYMPLKFLAKQNIQKAIRLDPDFLKMSCVTNPPNGDKRTHFTLPG